jgi:CSLREA domain-containing protein
VNSTLKAALTAAIASLALAAPAAAKTYEVNKRSDHAPNGCKKKDCTLREAVLAANNRGGNDRIVLPERKTYNLSIESSIPPGEDEAATGDLDITDPLRIQHPGKGRAKVDANAIDRVFDVFATATFKRVGIRGGETPSGGDDFGGGIRSVADVTLQRSSVTANTALNDGGGIGYDVGNASLTLRRSTVSNNVSGNDGGGLSFNETGSGQLVIMRSKFVGNEADDWAGGLITAIDARIDRSTFARNESLGGNGGGVAIEIPEALITNSTFSGNSAAQSGGGFDVNDGADVTAVNVTVAGNRADEAGGGVYSDSTASLNAVSVVRNAAGEFGGGLFNEGAFAVENSLVALNNAGNSGDDCAGNLFDSLGHNLLSEDTDCDGFDASGDFVNSNPKLGQLKNNGGPTQTVALKKGSPAINKAKQSAPNKDQRGEKRGKRPDIGAYERVKKKKKKGRR